MMIERITELQYRKYSRFVMVLPNMMAGGPLENNYKEPFNGMLRYGRSLVINFFSWIYKSK